MFVRTLNLICAMLVLVLSIAAAMQTVRLANEKRAHAETKEGHAKAMQSMADLSALAERQAREEERRRYDQLRRIADDAKKSLLNARADASAAADAGQRLRDRIAALTANCRFAAGDSAAGATGKATEPTDRVLADVQRRLGEAAERIAAHADAARVAGLACQQSYDAITSGN